MKRAIKILNWSLALLLVIDAGFMVPLNLSEGRKFTLDQMIITPFAIVWAYSVFTRVHNRLVWGISVLGGLVVLCAGLVMLDRVRAHVRLGRLDPSDGTVFAMAFGGFA